MSKVVETVRAQGTLVVFYGMCEKSWQRRFENFNLEDRSGENSKKNRQEREKISYLICVTKS